MWRRDVDRPRVMELKKEFVRFDDRPGGPFGELEDDQVRSRARSALRC
jgi:hypothetical protein